MKRLLTAESLTFGSATLLIGAFGFEHFGGYAPCDLCWIQRYIHMAAVAIGLIYLFSRWTGAAVIAAGSLLLSALTAGYHAGIEIGWWAGRSACAGAVKADLSPEEMVKAIMEMPLIRCDQVEWVFLGLSMAGWNTLISLLMFMVWVAIITRSGMDQSDNETEVSGPSERSIIPLILRIRLPDGTVKDVLRRYIFEKSLKKHQSKMGRD